MSPGQISVDTAEVRGTVADHLVVQSNLILRSTGSITGSIAYSKVMVEEGGALAGTIEKITKAGAAGDGEHKVVPLHAGE
jgi:cytoskeletal protein CcmA (bactofilin family)